MSDSDPQTNETSCLPTKDSEDTWAKWPKSSSADSIQETSKGSDDHMVKEQSTGSSCDVSTDAGRSTDSKGSTGRPARARGYQETRRLDRDRRNNWRQNEKKAEKSTEEVSREGKARPQTKMAESDQGEPAAPVVKASTASEPDKRKGLSRDAEEVKTAKMSSTPVSKSKSDSAQPGTGKNSGQRERTSSGHGGSTGSSGGREDRGKKYSAERRTDKSRGGTDSKGYGDGPKARDR